MLQNFVIRFYIFLSLAYIKARIVIEMCVKYGFRFASFIKATSGIMKMRRNFHQISTHLYDTFAFYLLRLPSC